MITSIDDVIRSARTIDWCSLLTTTTLLPVTKVMVVFLKNVKNEVTIVIWNMCMCCCINAIIWL